MPDKTLIPQRKEYYVRTGSMFENPFGVPHDEIVSMILEQPAEMSAQIVFGKYVESSGLVFTGELIQMMIDRIGAYYGQLAGQDMPRVTSDRWTHMPTWEQARLMSFDQKRGAFHTGIDWARTNDFTVLITLDTRFRPARVVSYRRLNRVPWEGLYREAGRYASMWGPSILCDATGMAGDVILDALEERHYCPIHDRTVMREVGRCLGPDGKELGGCKPKYMIPLNCVDGIQFTKSSKQGLIEHLRSAMSQGYRAGSDERFGLIRMPPIAQIEEEMSFYSWDDKHLDTDTVMALALAAWDGLELATGDVAFGPVHADWR
jgi:hypothetical protein